MRSSETVAIRDLLQAVLQDIKTWRAAVDERQRVFGKLCKVYDRMAAGLLCSNSTRKKGGIQWRAPHDWLVSSRKVPVALEQAGWSNEAQRIRDILAVIGDVPLDLGDWPDGLEDALRKASDQMVVMATVCLGALHAKDKCQTSASPSSVGVVVNNQVNVEVIAQLTLPGAPAANDAHNKTDATPVPAKPEQSQLKGGAVATPPPNDTAEQAEEESGLPRHDKPPEVSEDFVFALDGDTDYIAGCGESGHVERLKGFDLIARLVEAPRVGVPMRELVGAAGDERVAADTRSRQETLDNVALRQIHDELLELRADCERAKAEGNTVEVDIAEQQIAQLESRLRQDTGLAGRSRDMNSEVDKLRPRIHGVLKTAYKTLRAARPPMNELAEHFEAAISSEGGEFVYRPARPTEWTTSRLAKM